MFRLTQSDLARSVVARETRTKVRYFDPETARMSGWMPKPFPVVAEGELDAVALQGAGRAALSITVDTSRFETALYGAMPVAQLRKLASESGVKNASRMRKADIISALTA